MKEKTHRRKRLQATSGYNAIRFAAACCRVSKRDITAGGVSSSAKNVCMFRLIDAFPALRLLPNRLEDGEIVLFAASPERNGQGSEQYEILLQTDEKKRADGYLFDHLRRDFVFGRALLRLLLHHYTGVPAGKILFSYDEYGKPALLDEKGQSKISFSVSNTRGMLLIALASRGKIGVDLEHVRSAGDSRNMALYCLSAAELAAYETSTQDVDNVFFHYWCRKEAYLKAKGTGLVDNLPDIDTSAAEVSDEGCASGFLCRSLSLFPGYYSALCYEAAMHPLTALRYFFLQET